LSSSRNAATDTFARFFSPHADKQAEDRAYRIGQVRDVNVIKLICKDSVEEMMRDLAVNKLALDSEVSGGVQGSNADEDDGNSAQIEKSMKSSILTTLKMKFVNENLTNNGEDADRSKEDSKSSDIEMIVVE
jgi:hypothetical protein